MYFLIEKFHFVNAPKTHGTWHSHFRHIIGNIHLVLKTVHLIGYVCQSVFYIDFQRTCLYIPWRTVINRSEYTYKTK